MPDSVHRNIPMVGPNITLVGLNVTMGGPNIPMVEEQWVMTEQTRVVAPPHQEKPVHDFCSYTPHSVRFAFA